MTKHIIKAPIEIKKNNSIPVTKSETKKALGLNRALAKPTNLPLAPVIIARGQKRLNTTKSSNAADKIPAKNASLVFHKGLLYIRRRRTGLIEEEHGEGSSEEDPLVYVEPEYIPPDDDEDDDDTDDDDSDEEEDDDGGGGDEGEDDDDDDEEDDDGDGDGDDGNSDDFFDEDQTPCPTNIDAGDLYDFYEQYFEGFLGGYGTVSFSTGTPPGYELVNGQFYDPSTKTYAGGVTYCAPVNGEIGPITIYIAPLAIQQGAAFVEGTMGHELIHALDIYQNPSLYLNNPSQWNSNSEYAAYSYQAQISASNFSEEYSSSATGFYQNKADQYGTGRNADWNQGLDTPSKPGQTCV